MHAHLIHVDPIFKISSVVILGFLKLDHPSNDQVSSIMMEDSKKWWFCGNFDDHHQFSWRMLQCSEKKRGKWCRIQAANNPKVSLWSNWVVLEGPKPMAAFQPVTWNDQWKISIHIYHIYHIYHINSYNIMDYTNGVSTMAESSFHESLANDFGGCPSTDSEPCTVPLKRRCCARPSRPRV